MTYVRHPPQDGSSIAYTLIIVQSERCVTPVTHYELKLKRSSGESDVKGDGHAGFPFGLKFSVHQICAINSLDV